MIFRACAWEAELTQALRAGHWPDASGPELRAHVENCPACSDLVLVTEFMQRARRAAALAAHTVSPSLLWWRAELRRRNYAAERISQPINIAQSFAWLVSWLLAGVFVVSQYRYGLRWGSWWSEFTAAHMLRLRSLAAADLQWNLPLLISSVGVFLLLSAIALYLARE